MAKVKLMFGRDLQGEFNLDKPEMSVGRSRECDILVDNLGVSRHHCSFVRKDDKWAVVDKGSNNGTFMNGERVTEKILANGDQVVLGKFTLVYDEFGVAEGAGHGSGAKKAAGGLGSEMTMFVDPQAIKQMQDKKAEGGKVERMVLAVMQGGREVNCALVKSDTVIGRGLEADVPIRGLFVKPVQAKVIRAENGHRIVNFGGLRAVKVNGATIRDALLKPGDVITIAGTRITYKKL